MTGQRLADQRILFMGAGESMHPVCVTARVRGGASGGVLSCSAVVVWKEDAVRGGL